MKKSAMLEVLQSQYQVHNLPRILQNPSKISNSMNTRLSHNTMINSKVSGTDLLIQANNTSNFQLVQGSFQSDKIIRVDSSLNFSSDSDDTKNSIQVKVKQNLQDIQVVQQQLFYLEHSCGIIEQNMLQMTTHLSKVQRYINKHSESFSQRSMKW
ncbi:Hypothetical_protein [Hexamita inflata]|uniref:Hypothetical_protein n=1 Tax=Hexamita inflata TaxID=28002 RepID=A0AA86PUX8_9EUKA|nr:Hypothetical protein HINF_LOCUS31658 [Hexamita inflata]